MPRALITGITGQDGRLLSEFLIGKGYEVYGLIRGQNNPKKDLVHQKVHLVEGDLTDYGSLTRAVSYVCPDEVYNLGAISHVGLSFKQPETTANVTGLGCLRLLEAVRTHRPQSKFYQASTSELYGKIRESPQTELTPFYPRSPYGSAKAFAHYSTVNYRESYDMHASCGILFNHESTIRGYEFVTRKITQGVARILLGLQTKIELGTIETYRDWGYAGDYVEAMWLMLQQDQPDDYVIATGQIHSIVDLLDTAFGTIDIDDWTNYVVLSSEYKRPAEVQILLGNPSKAYKKLGWYARTTFQDLIYMMVRNDIKIERQKLGSMA